MKIKPLYSIFLCALPFFTSCVKEDRPFESALKGTLALRASAPADPTDEEKQINNMRIMTFGPQGSPIAGVLDVNSGSKSTTTGSITATLHVGERDLYVFANETEEISAALNDIRDLSDLKDVKITHTHPIRPPFLSSYMEGNINIVESKTEIEASLQPAVSKIRLNLKYNWGTAPLTEELIIDKVSVKNLPAYSYIIPQPYGAKEKRVTYTIEDCANETLTPNRYEKQLVIYIPEYIGATKDNHASIEIVGLLKNGATCTYRIPLSSSIQPNGTIPSDSYNITRNTFFDITPIFLSYGEVDNMSVKVEVMDWDTAEIAEEIGKPASFVVTNKEGTPLEDHLEVDETDETIAISCEKNIGEWYVVVTKGGKIVDKIQASAIGGTSGKNVLISIPELAKNIDFSNYTIDIYTSSISESTGSIKKVSLTQSRSYLVNLDRQIVGVGYLAEQQRVSLTSNGMNWKLTQPDGTTVFSYAEGKTMPYESEGITYSISGNAHNATIVVSKPTDGKFTTTTQFYIEAQGMEKKSFKVIYDNGFLTREELVAGGWNTNLPAKGLQMAKKNNVLPEGVAAPGIELNSGMKWGPDGLTGIANTDFGAGKTNTDALYKKGEAYQMARKCKELGEGWYLPSFNELTLIYNKRETYGESYQYNSRIVDEAAYYSSSDHGNTPNIVKGVSFSGSYHQDFFKANPNRFRCVKNI